MYRAFRHQRIRCKLTLLMVAASMITLLLASLSLFAFQWWNTHRVITRDLLVQGQILAANSTAALKFQDGAAATEMLAALQANPHILSASLHQPDGEALAHYGAEQAALRQLPAGTQDGLRFKGPHVELFQPVTLEAKRIGTLHLRFDFRAMEREIILPFLMITGGTFLAAFLVALALATALHPFISRPILRLADTARAVAEKKDFSVRADVVSDDETGTLTAAFNHMLGQIQAQDAEITRSQRRLEALVHSIDGVVWECTPDTFQFTFVSRQSQRLLGYTPEQGLAHPRFWQEHLHPQDADQAVEHRHQAVARREPYQYEYRMLAADGREVWIRECGSVLTEGENPVAVRGLFLDVTAQKEAAAELDLLNRRLIETSRTAGMAEVATGVLHNVGNVLNSVNVSVNVLQDGLTRSRLASLRKTADLLRQHESDWEAYLTGDAKGRLIPGFVVKLAEVLSTEHHAWLEEVRGLARNIEHVKEIVAMQQSYARVAGMMESLAPAQLVEDALHINQAGLTRHRVRIIRQFEPVPLVVVDKHKVIQILTNLIRNAKYAMDEGPAPEHHLRLGIAANGSGRVKITVQDNGVGIPAENLTRIFGHGFTTKQDGHGFGLHSGALAAKELGGSLSAASEGVGRGAMFTLELPVAEPGDDLPCPTPA